MLPMIWSHRGCGRCLVPFSRPCSLCLQHTGICFITGGKWTTYREMAEDTVNRVIKEKGFKDVGPCVTRHLPLIGLHD